MASVNLADATLEYLFNEQEKILAKQLSPLQVMWIQTKYAQTWKAKASLSLPTDPKDYNAYFLEIANFEGQLAVLQQLIDECMESNLAIKTQQLVDAESKKKEDEDLAKRASQQVHN